CRLSWSSRSASTQAAERSCATACAVTPGCAAKWANAASSWALGPAILGLLGSVQRADGFHANAPRLSGHRVLRDDRKRQIALVVAPGTQLADFACNRHVAIAHRHERIVVVVEPEAADGRHIGRVACATLEIQADALLDRRTSGNEGERIEPAIAQALGMSEKRGTLRRLQREPGDRTHPLQAQVLARLQTFDQRQEPPSDLL